MLPPHLVWEIKPLKSLVLLLFSVFLLVVFKQEWILSQATFAMKTGFFSSNNAMIFVLINFSKTLMIREGKQRKLLPWRRFENVIVIVVKIGEHLFWISTRIYRWFEVLHQTFKILSVSFVFQTPRRCFSFLFFCFFQPTSWSMESKWCSSFCLIYYCFVNMTPQK